MKASRVGVFLSLPFLAACQDFATCELATAFAWLHMRQELEACAVDLSYCLNPSDASCPSNGCFDAGDVATATCYDGCSYSFEGYEISRYFIGGTSTFSTVIATTFVNIVSEVGWFSQGGEGSYTFLREVTPTSDGEVNAYPFGGFCTFEFNGQECECEQRYCDDSRESWGYFVDCSAFEGGSILQQCAVPMLTSESSVLDILFYVPFLECHYPNATDSPGTLSPATSTVPIASEPNPTVGIGSGSATFSPIRCLAFTLGWVIGGAWHRL